MGIIFDEIFNQIDFEKIWNFSEVKDPKIETKEEPKDDKKEEEDEDEKKKNYADYEKDGIIE